MVQPKKRNGEINRQITDNINMRAKMHVEASSHGTVPSSFGTKKRTLLNTYVECPALAMFLTNIYRNNSKLYIDGEVILSREGTTQGGPEGMPMYALGILPMIKRLIHIVRQMWYADDSVAGGTLVRLRQWWDMLNEIGPDYGYFLNPKKTKLLVKEDVLEEATLVFAGTGVTIVSEGHKYLGCPIGTEEFVRDFVQKRTDKWIDDLEKLVKVAEIQPQCAYAAFTHSFVPKWNYLLRVLDFEPEELARNLVRLEATVREKLIPKFTGHIHPGTVARDMLELPARLGGMNIVNVVTSAQAKYCNADMLSKTLVEKILSGASDLNWNSVRSNETPENTKKKSDECWIRKKHAVINEIEDPGLRRSIELASEKGASNWLTVLPIDEHGFSLPKTHFRDAIITAL